MHKTPLIFLVAGEASGDYLGARLMAALKAKTSDNVQFVGIGGPRMKEEGLDLLFDQSELSHMGLFAVLAHLPQILRRIRYTIQTIKEMHPDALVTIDSPDFSFRVAKKLKGQGIPLIHYVAPTVWAWRPKRAKKIAAFLDHLLVLLPFEPPYFLKEGLPCTFVGHPLVESQAGRGEAKRFRSSFGIKAETPLLAVLPGSRMSEIHKLLPIFQETVLRLKDKIPDLEIVVPVVPHLEEVVASQLEDWPVRSYITRNDQDKYDAFAACRAALACSGTVSVELAMAGLPTIIAYRASALTFALYRRLIKTPYATLLNIMKNEEVMPEYIQDDCCADKLEVAVGDLLQDEKARQRQKEELQDIGVWLGRGQFIPSEKAAETVLEVINSPLLQ
ncbi:MAG: lipid-A-disaccharide synthase [Bdellovibrionales bacterium]